jgi:hypothetical protein
MSSLWGISTRFYWRLYRHSNSSNKGILALRNTSINKHVVELVVEMVITGIIWFSVVKAISKHVYNMRATYPA